MRRRVPRGTSYREVHTPQRARTSRHVGHYRRGLSPEEMNDALAASPVLIAGRTGDGHVVVALDAGTYENPATWGIVLADIAGHVANAYAGEGMDPSAVRAAVVELFLAEIQHPTGKPVRIGSIVVGRPS